MTIAIWEKKMTEIFDDGRRLQLSSECIETLIEDLDAQFENERPFKLIGHNLFPTKRNA